MERTWALTPTHLAMIYLLVRGSSRSAIARDLYLSARAVDQRIADLKRSLAAPDRFGLGVAAVRDGLVHPSYPVRKAAVRRIHPGWVAPRLREYEMIRLRAGGATTEQVATALGRSASGVRRDLARLARINGAPDAVSAGALFEALGWIRR